MVIRSTLIVLIAMLVGGAMMVAPPAHAADLVLGYPTERTDGTALKASELEACHIVDVGASPEQLLVTLIPPATNHTIPNSQLLTERRFQAYCTDKNGLDSPRSPVFRVAINPAKSPGLSITFRAGAI